MDVELTNCLQNDLLLKIDEFVESLPDIMKIELNHYMDQDPESSFEYEYSEDELIPLWIQIIELLIADIEIQKNNSKIDNNYLSKIIWIQYSLITAYRIKDDLYDGEFKDQSLIYSSDLFLIESIKSLHKYPGLDKSFWDWFYKILEFSIKAALTVDDKQRDFSSDPDEIFNNYEDMCSIFSVGIKLICKELNLNEASEKLINYNKKVLSAFQLIDDILDMEEDLERGRYNFVTLSLMSESYNYSNLKPIPAEELGVLFKERGLGKIFTKILDELTEAKKGIHELKLKGLDEFVDRNIVKMSELKDLTHKLRVDLIFNEFEY